MPPFDDIRPHDTPLHGHPLQGFLSIRPNQLGRYWLNQPSSCRILRSTRTLMPRSGASPDSSLLASAISVAILHPISFC